MNFKFSTNFLLPYARKPAKYGGCGSTGLDATPTVPIHTGHPVLLIEDTYFYFSQIHEFVKLCDEHLTFLYVTFLNALSQNWHLKGFSPV